MFFIRSNFDFTIYSNWTNDYATICDLNEFIAWASTSGSVTMSGVTFTYTGGTTFKFNKNATIYITDGPVGQVNALVASDYTANSNITRVKNRLYLIELK